MNRKSTSLILGIHGNYMDYSKNVHESSASLIENGKILGAISEERISRKKMDGRFPFSSIEELLRITGKSFNQIDHVAVSESHPLKTNFKHLASIFSTYFDTSVFLRKAFQEYLHYSLTSLKTPKHLNFSYKTEKKLSIDFTDHHFSHAASAYYSSPFNESLVITLDGGGDGLDGGAYTGSDTSLKRFLEIPHHQSPGTMYSAITYDLGFTRLRHEGKITGLAAYGNHDIKEMGL